MRVDGLPLQYSGYKVDVDRTKQRIEKRKDNGNYYDGAEISMEGKQALERKMSALAEQRGVDGICHLSSVSSYDYISDFEKALSDLGKSNVSSEYLTGNYAEEIADIASQFEPEKGEKTDSFDRYVNKMVSVYNMMRDKIEAKYADSQREAEYYVADNGEIEELTKEKELKMIDKAYANHSTFIATSTEIWTDLQDFTPTVVYHKGSKQVDEEQTVNVSRKENTAEYGEKGKIKEMVSQAFLSAASDENRVLLAQQEGSLNHFKLNLGISSSARGMLNGVWAYYANKA